VAAGHTLCLASRTAADPMMGMVAMPNVTSGVSAQMMLSTFRVRDSGIMGAGQRTPWHDKEKR